MDGLWNGNQAGESIRQSKLTRHRLLVVETSITPATPPTDPWGEQAASGYASADPNSINPGTTTSRGAEGGPHFVLSGETPDESHTYGFEFALWTADLTPFAIPNDDTDAFDVTIWVLITTTQRPNGFITPEWAALETQTGVGLRELWHSFDVNATAIRFQFGNIATDGGIGIALSEL